MAKAIASLCEPDGIPVLDLRDKFAADTPDEIWIGALGQEGSWAILSQDRFAKNPLEQEAFRQSGLTAFILQKSWTGLQQWDKAWHLVRWWPRIVEQAGLVQGGAAFLVPIKFSGKGKFKQTRI